MKSNYKTLGNFIRKVNTKNTDGSIKNLLGVNLSKKLMPSVAKTNGVDLTKYKVLSKNQFACKFMSVGRDEMLPIGFYQEDYKSIVSSAYYVFESKDENILYSQYLMMWLSRSENDRLLWFKSGADVRGSISWADFCEIEIPIPTIEKQREIVHEYNIVNNRILLNERLIHKLEDTAQSIYKHWFVDFEFPISKEYAEFIGKPELEGKPYRSSGGEIKNYGEIEEQIPLNWNLTALSSQAEVIMGQSPSGEHLSTIASGTVFYQGRTDFNFRFPSERIYTSLVKRLAQPKDVLMSVRAPVGDVNIASEKCAIGRGIAAIRDKCGVNSFIYYSLQNLSSMFNITDGEGTIFGSIKKDELNELNVIYPDMNTKEEFNNRVGRIDDMIEVIEKELICLRSLRTLINSKMTRLS
ncbi:restriction endonuclease subunit S [Nitrosomonadales bacterium]|nr:restriction endonuclease subunit S [Nitrosomonadales bacterium]